jgi:hypothetical protein
MNQEIKDQDYRVVWTPETATLVLQGTLRLLGPKEYAPIAHLLDEAAQCSEQITLDLQGLHFLNSAGINLIYRFIIRARDEFHQEQVVVRGSPQVAWQGKSLENMQNLMPTLQLEWV